MPPADAPLRVFHVTAPADVGGLERVVQGLAVGQRAVGHDAQVVAVVGPEDSPTAFLDPLSRSGVPVHMVRVRARGYLAERRAVTTLLARYRPDVLHTHGYRSDLLHLPTARRLRIPIVTTLHGSSRMGGVSHLFEWVQERMLKRFDGVIAVSGALHSRLLELGVTRERLHLIPNAWPGPQGGGRLDRKAARSLLGVGQDEYVYGWVARLIPAKGCDLLLEAIALMRPGGWSVAIVGDGPQKDMLLQRTQALGIGDRVRFAGQVPEAERVMTAFDSFVLSSRTEGTPMVLFEAMAARLPVVAHAVGGVPDVLGGGAGLLVPVGDADALAAALEAVRTRPEHADRRACIAGEKLSTEYSVHEWLQRHDRAYRAAAATVVSRPKPRNVAPVSEASVS
jgi:glycosyltransferase involved in cell wall biosynthesis